MNAALWVRVGPEKDGKRGSGAAGRDGLGAGVGERWRGRWTEGRVYMRASMERVWRTTVRSAFDILGLVYVSVGSREKDEKGSVVIAGSRKQGGDIGGSEHVDGQREARKLTTGDPRRGKG